MAGEYSDLTDRVLTALRDNEGYFSLRCVPYNAHQRTYYIFTFHLFGWQLQPTLAQIQSDPLLIPVSKSNPLCIIIEEGDADKENIGLHYRTGKVKKQTVSLISGMMIGYHKEQFADGTEKLVHNPPNI